MTLITSSPSKTSIFNVPFSLYALNFRDVAFKVYPSGAYISVSVYSPVIYLPFTYSYKPSIVSTPFESVVYIAPSPFMPSPVILY